MVTKSPLAATLADNLKSQLRAARENEGLSRPALAKASGVSGETIERFESTGRGNLGSLTKLLSILNCRLGEQPDHIDIGAWLRALRIRCGMSLQTAAQSAVVSKPAVGRAERGQGQVATAMR